MLYYYGFAIYTQSKTYCKKYKYMQQRRYNNIQFCKRHTNIKTSKKYTKRYIKINNYIVSKAKLYTHNQKSFTNCKNAYKIKNIITHSLIRGMKTYNLVENT